MTSAEYVTVPIYRGGKVVAHALVDCDFPLLRLRWTFGKDWYVIASEGRANRYLMHRVVLGLSKGDGLEGDHIDGNKLDNRRSNLRVATRRQNGQNVPARGGSSRYRGVMWDPSRRTGRSWRVRPILNGKSIHVGWFDTEEEAAAAAVAWRAEHMPFANETRSVAA